MTIYDLLSKPYYCHNQSLLARDLGVNRATLRKFMKDKEGVHHFVKGDAYNMELFTNQTNKVSEMNNER